MGVGSGWLFVHLNKYKFIHSRWLSRCLSAILKLAGSRAIAFAPSRERPPPLLATALPLHRRGPAYPGQQSCARSILQV